MSIREYISAPIIVDGATIQDEYGNKYQLAYASAPDPSLVGGFDSTNALARLALRGISVFSADTDLVPNANAVHFMYIGELDEEPSRSTSINVRMVDQGWCYFSRTKGLVSTLSDEVSGSLVSGETRAVEDRKGIWKHDFWYNMKGNRGNVN